MTPRTTTTPLRDETLRRPDGRRLAWAEWGRPDGAPALLLHSSPGSRLLDPDPAATAAAGVRLVTVDRPGFGGSDPDPDPTFAGFAADLATLAADLDLRDLAILGWSGGGQYALVAAAGALAGRLRSLSLLAAPAPDDEVPWVAEPFRPWLAAVREDPRGAVGRIAESLGGVAAQPEAILRQWTGPAEAPVVERPEVAEALGRWVREAVRQGGLGMAGDMVAGSRGDRLPVDEVRAPVRLWYGDADHIGPEHGRWYAGRLPGAALTVLPGAGHLLPVAHWGPILEAALSPAGRSPAP
jgi:pimeloyl-ACP methyl ester carboxylesterase